MPDREVQRECLGALLARSGSGDGHAFSILYRMSVSKLLPIAFRIVKTSAVAEDVVQESFMAIWRDAASFDATRAAPLTWMSAIVRNKAVDYLRANQLGSMSAPDDDSAGALMRCDPSAQPCEAAADAQCRLMIGFALARLEDKPRRAIELAFFHDLTHGEVALEMTAPLGTVKTWIRRGCLSLRRHVAPSLR